MNRNKARRIATEIREHEENWDQESWWQGEGYEMPVARLLEHACGTTGCVAGWGAALEYPAASFEGAEKLVIPVPVGTWTANVRDVARYSLELTDEQASWLFSQYRAQDEVLWALENDNPDWTPEDYGDGCDDDRESWA